MRNELHCFITFVYLTSFIAVNLFLSTMFEKVLVTLKLYHNRFSKYSGDLNTWLV